jgi:hypothetical protein
MAKGESSKYQFMFDKRQVVGKLSSNTVKEAREELIDAVCVLGKKAQREAAEIEDLALELKGDPWASSKYSQAMELASMLCRLKSLLDNTCTFPKPARAMDDERIG